MTVQVFSVTKTEYSYLQTVKVQMQMQIMMCLEVKSRAVLKQRGQKIEKFNMSPSAAEHEYLQLEHLGQPGHLSHHNDYNCT